MKTVIIYIYDIDSKKFPFDTPYYADGYLDLLLGLRASGVKAYFTTGAENYLGEGRFSVAYTTDHKCAPEEFERHENVVADLVFNRGTFELIDPDFFTPNPVSIIDILRSKAEIYTHFGQFQPKSIACNSQAEVEAAFAEIQGDMIVAKEPVGGSGDFVYIGSRKEVLAKLPNRFPILVQEFMDTSIGIPGLVDGIHDLRLELAGGVVIGGTIRQPNTPGEYRANVSRGGKEIFLYPNQIPAEAMAIALEIDSHFKGLPRDYSADFGNTPHGFRLIEMNRIPAIVPASQGPAAKNISDGLIAYLIQLVTTGKTEQS